MQPHEIAAAIIGAFSLLGLWVWISYIRPACPFCGARMVRSVIDAHACYCHKCGASKHGDHYISGQGWHDAVARRERPAGRASER